MNSSNATILVVDDDRHLVAFVTTILEAEGYIVYTAANGEEGLNRATQMRPSLILMDIRMPIMDGLTCRQLLKQCQETVEIPIIMMSADGAGAMVARTQGESAHFLHKPFDIDELLHRVRELAGSSTP